MKQKNIIYKIFSDKLISLKKEIILDEEIKRVLKLLTYYFTENKEFEKYSFNDPKNEIGKKIKYSLNKGILLLGTNGRSKSFLFENVYNFYTKENKKHLFYRKTDAHKIEQSYRDNYKKGHLSFLLNSFETNSAIYTTFNIAGNTNWYIDELGAEASTINIFGNDIKPMELFLNHRVKILEKTDNKIKTHATGNLSLTKFKEKYGNRLYSRLFRLFNIIYTTGQDFSI